MRKTFPLINAAAALVALAAQLSAGGFWLQLGNPEASPQARALHAVLTMRTVGCHKPEEAVFSARAIGIVSGNRQEIALKLTPLSEPGSYALTRQWPAEGKWVVELVATNQGLVTSALVADTSGGLDRKSAKFAAGRPKSEDVEALLGGAAALARK